MKTFKEKTFWLSLVPHSNTKPKLCRDMDSQDQVWSLKTTSYIGKQEWGRPNEASPEAVQWSFLWIRPFGRLPLNLCEADEMKLPLKPDQWSFPETGQMKLPLKPDGQWLRTSGWNEASTQSVPSSIRPVVPLSIRPVVHANRYPGSSDVAGCRPSFPLLSLTLQLSAHQDILKDVGMKWSFVPSSIPSSVASSVQTQQIYFFKRKKLEKKRTL
jgi:hypothetical protein